MYIYASNGYAQHDLHPNRGLSRPSTCSNHPRLSGSSRPSGKPRLLCSMAACRGRHVGGVRQPPTGQGDRHRLPQEQGCVLGSQPNPTTVRRRDLHASVGLAPSVRQGLGYDVHPDDGPASVNGSREAVADRWLVSHERVHSVIR